MTIYKTAYDTTAIAGRRVQETEDKLVKGLVSGAFSSTNVELNGHTNSFTLHLLEGGNSSADVIPYFAHPFHVKALRQEEEGKKVMEFVVDVRNFGKWYSPNQEFVVRNRVEFDWNVKRALLNQIWVNERQELFRDISLIPAQVYASMIGECIARRFALDTAEQATISVLAAYFYAGLFTDDVSFEELEAVKLAGSISRVTNVPAEKIMTILQDLPVIANLVDFCEVCKTKTGSVALTGLNVGVLIAIVGGNWFGTNARENIAVALEHVPTWIMIVAAALREATFKRSVVSKLAQRYDKGGAANNFVKSLDVLLGGPGVIQSQILKSE